MTSISFCFICIKKRAVQSEPELEANVSILPPGKKDAKLILTLCLH
jgi:hypothetical protein